MRGTMMSKVVKDCRGCCTELYTIGYQPLGCGFRCGQYKPFHTADQARSQSTEGVPIDVFLLSDKYPLNIRWWVDVTPFDRWHDPDNLHIGEHTNHIVAIISSAPFQQVMTVVKRGWKLFLRDGSADSFWNGLFFDPYGMCRSVAFARIIHFCLEKTGFKSVPVMHLSREWWTYGDCGGACDECRLDRMSENKTAALQRAYDMWLEC